ncbi:3139_t:CDS:1, partial [Racocetra fulgida]
MEEFLLHEDLDNVRIASAFYKRVLLNEWTANKKQEVDLFIDTLKK